jgi:hypothetical protein
MLWLAFLCSRQAYAREYRRRKAAHEKLIDLQARQCFLSAANTVRCYCHHHRYLQA